MSKKTKRIVIISIFIFAIGIICYFLFIGGIWFGKYKYKLNIVEKTAYFLDYHGDGNDILPQRVMGLDVKIEDTTCWVGDFYCWFNPEKEKVYIKDYNITGQLVLPSEILGIPVYYYSDIENNNDITCVFMSNNPDNCNELMNFRSCNNIQTVIYEDGTECAWGNFSGCEKLSQIIIPTGVKELDVGFNDTAVKELYIPDSVVEVSPMFFSKITEDMKIYFGAEVVERLHPENVRGTVIAPADSYMEQFCKENNINFQVMTVEEEAVWREKTEKHHKIISE